MNLALRDDAALPSEERSARRAGRRASVAGAAGGSVAGVAALSAFGSVAGLGAAGITSGLAAIGGVVGGGMVAGSAVIIAGPAVAAAGIGYGHIGSFGGCACQGRRETFRPSTTAAPIWATTTLSLLESSGSTLRSAEPVGSGVTNRPSAPWRWRPVELRLDRYLGTRCQDVL